MSFVYVLFRRLLELVVLLGRGEWSKELEILVLRRKSAFGRHAGIESAVAARVSATHRTPPRVENDSEFGNVT